MQHLPWGSAWETGGFLQGRSSLTVWDDGGISCEDKTPEILKGNARSLCKNGEKEFGCGEEWFLPLFIPFSMVGYEPGLRKAQFKLCSVDRARQGATRARKAARWAGSVRRSRAGDCPGQHSQRCHSALFWDFCLLETSWGTKNPQFPGATDQAGCWPKCGSRVTPCGQVTLFRNLTGFLAGSFSSGSLFPFPRVLLSQLSSFPSPGVATASPAMLRDRRNVIALKVRTMWMRPKFPTSLLFLFAFPPFNSCFPPVYTGFQPCSSARGSGSCPAAVPRPRSRAAPQPEPGAPLGLVNLLPARKIWQLWTRAVC